MGGERLDQIAEGSGSDRRPDRVSLARRTQNHTVTGQFADQIDAGAVWQIDVDQGEVGPGRQIGGEGGVGGGRFAHLVAEVGEEVAEGAADLGLVVDDEHAQRLRHRRLRAARG